jgi:hypothetical protein
MLQGKPGSAGARTPNKPRSNSSPPSVQKQQQAQQRKQKATAVQQGSNVQQKRPAQRVSTLQSPPEPKRQAPIREAFSPVRPDPPSKDVIFSNLARLAAEDKGSLQFQGQIKYVVMMSGWTQLELLSPAVVSTPATAWAWQ